MIFFDYLKQKLFSSDGISSSNTFTNQLLVDNIEKVFSSIVDRDSVDDRILYDSSFMIVVPEEKYESICLQAPGLSKAIVKRFYKVLKKKKKKKPILTPISANWDFQFVANTGKDSDESRIMDIYSQVTTKKSWSETLKEEKSIGSYSLNGKHSNYSNWNVATDFFKNVNILEKGHISIRFNSSLQFADETDTSLSSGSEKVKTNEQNQNEKLALITYDENNSKMEYGMRKPFLTISKATSPNEQLTLDRLSIITDSKSLKENHIEIRYDAGSRLFYIAVYAATTVDGKDVQVSYSNDNPKWHQLKQKSDIYCGMYHIEFRALK